MCDHGYCERHQNEGRYLLDHDPCYADPGEVEAERRNAALSAVYFKEPFNAG